MKTGIKTIKVEDTSIIGRAIIISVLIPLVYLFLFINFKLNYLFLIVVFLISLIVGILFLAIYLKRKENFYEIIADSNSIVIRNSMHLNWLEVEKIETFSESGMSFSKNRKYLKIILKDDSQIVLNASNYDIWYKDLKKELELLKETNNLDL